MMYFQLFTLLALFWCAEASYFRGSFVTWVVNQTDTRFYPANLNATYAKVHGRYGVSWKRSTGSSFCTDTSISNCQYFYDGIWNLYYDYNDPNKAYPSKLYISFSSGFYCERFNIPYDFTVGSNQVILYIPKDYNYRVSMSSCCWVNGLVSNSSSSYNVEAIISLDMDSQFLPYRVNTPPQIDHIPVIQHYLHISQSYSLPVSDPDGDQVQCRWAGNFSEGGGIWNSRIPIATLSSNCVLNIYYSSNHAYLGWYALAVMVEDFRYSYVTYRMEKRSSVPLQFTVFIHSGSPTAIYGIIKTDCPKTLPPVPSIEPTPHAFYPVTPTIIQPSASSSVATPSSLSPMQALDGCTHYQILSEADRSFSFQDGGTSRCDRELYGWYRFMGMAGTRMANNCPAIRGPYHWCGSYHQGWILTGGMPSVYDGVVSRYVCFSSYYSCYCSYSTPILMKNCGSFYVYFLNEVPTCNLRYCGDKENTSNVICSNNYMRIEMNRSYYDPTLYSSITLKNPSCTAYISSTSIILGSAPGACGSEKSETSSHIVYENEVIFTSKPNSPITRNVEYRVKFSCFYDKNAIVQPISYQPISNVTGYEVGYGNFTFNFVMYTSHQYATMHTHYPVSVNLRDWIYLEIYASNIDNSIVVLVDQCYSTPNMDRNHPMKYIFINNRCPTDNTVKFHSTTNDRQRFSLQAFKYFNSSTAVYLHCLVFLCHKWSTDYRCSSGCSGNTIHRSRREVGSDRNDPSGLYMVEMQVKLKADSEPKPPDKNIGSTVGLICGLGVAVGVIAGLALKLHKLNKAAKVSPANERYADKHDEGKVDLPEKETKVHEINNCQNDMEQIGVISKEQQEMFFKYM